MTTTRKIEWTNSKGQQVVAAIGIRTGKTINADGDEMTVSCCEWYETVYLAGQIAGYSIDRITPVQVGAILVAGKSGTVGIPVEQMDAIDAARAELRATPVWAEHEAKIARNVKECEEYEASRRYIERVMGGSY